VAVDKYNDIDYPPIDATQVARLLTEEMALSGLLVFDAWSDLEPRDDLTAHVLSEVFSCADRATREAFSRLLLCQWLP
jgi:hypothetical protein